MILYRLILFGTSKLISVYIINIRDPHYALIQLYTVQATFM